MEWANSIYYKFRGVAMSIVIDNTNLTPDHPDFVPFFVHVLLELARDGFLELNREGSESDAPGYVSSYAFVADLYYEELKDKLTKIVSLMVRNGSLWRLYEQVKSIGYSHDSIVPLQVINVLKNTN
ncbi:hypothetical protein IPA_02280 [Ignicoccus pacificus DSM 13166]|uniref:Uncharacterized protein n=1 Tax=Ignicoccus pacificus DSM 13166 TaxID=940294 RepID=A0A977PL64_9CREN|nr:hypothetical protein IPA_02280 [Ignicoccus pacificus DSM 13166]